MVENIYHYTAFAGIFFPLKPVFFFSWKFCSFYWCFVGKYLFVDCAAPPELCFFIDDVARNKSLR